MNRPSAPLRAALQRTVPPLLIALAIAIIMLGKADQRMFDSLRTTIADDVAPALDVLSRPLGAVAAVFGRLRAVVTVYQDNLRLEQENARLLQWQQAAHEYFDENRQLRALLKVVPHNAVSYVTARVIANSGGGYVRTLMVNAGGDQGAARGQAAITGDGLVGRLTEVGRRAARVLLITDLNSRIPVVVEASHTNAVLAGDNSDRPRLVYLGQSDTVKIGERVVTSGDGGIFPPGIPVGEVAALGPGGPRVEPFVELSQLGDVLIADYGLANGLPQPTPVATPSARHGKRPAPDEASVR